MQNTSIFSIYADVKIPIVYLERCIHFMHIDNSSIYARNVINRITYSKYPNMTELKRREKTAVF